MLRFYVWWAVLTQVIFTGLLLLSHSRPYDDHELRHLLLSEGCASPCFMGIKAGVTTVADAVKSLEASGWVGDMHVTKEEGVTDGEVYIHVQWKWNANASSMLDAAFAAHIYSYEQDIRSAVDEIRVATTINNGNIQLLLQTPTLYSLIEGMTDAFGKKPMILSLYYDGVENGLYLECPVRLRDTWTHQADLTFYSSPQLVFGSTQKWDSRQLIGRLRSNCG